MDSDLTIRNDFNSLDIETLLSFPPFYTEQINFNVLHSQLESWYRIISSQLISSSMKFIHITDTQCMEYPFSNPQINRSINRYFLLLITGYLIEQKLALWLEPQSTFSIKNLFKSLVNDNNSIQILYIKHIEFMDKLKTIDKKTNKSFNSNHSTIEELKLIRDNYLKCQITDIRAVVYPRPIDKICEELKEFAKFLCLYDQVETVYNLFYSPLGQKYHFHRLPDEHVVYLLSILVYNKWAMLIIPPSIKNGHEIKHDIKTLGIKFI